jgi:hypothetical protein
MTVLHPSRRAIDIVEAVAAGGLATAVALLSLIIAATLIYVWVAA